MSHSPVVSSGSSGSSVTPDNSIEFLDFPSALSAVIEGKCISKQEWNDLQTYGELRQGILMLRMNNKWHRWILSDGDLLGKDWFIVDWTTLRQPPNDVQ